MRSLRPAGGYSMLELILAVAMLIVLMAVAYPSFSRARASSIEVSTIGSLRAILSAQAVFAVTCGGGYYAPSLPWLGRSGGPGRQPFIGAEFDGNIVDRLGYRIRFTPGARAAAAPITCNGLAAGQAVKDYFVAAGPLEMTGPASTGRYFGINPRGVVFESPKRVRPVYSGTPPPPAGPLH
jgi:hypothetical protein